MENVPFFSKLLFHWVTPLMDKGAKKKLENSEDLYDLPINLTPAYLCSQLEMAMILSSVTKKHCPESGQYVQDCIQKFPDWPPGARTANGTALCH
jgi:hypothetical protein